MERTESFLAMESLTGLCQKLCDKTSGEAASSAEYESYAPLPVFSWYCRTHIHPLSSAQQGKVISRIAAEIHSGKLPALLSFTREEVPADFPLLLEQAGFTLRKPQTGMLLDLPSDFHEPACPEVVRIGADQIDAWSEVCTCAFGKTDETPAFRLLIDEPDCRFYARMHDGRIVATLMMSLQPGNAGIHEVGTLETMRGRGYCKSLLRRAFADAAAEGYPLISLQASNLGEPVYRTLGMRPVSHICNYVLK